MEGYRLLLGISIPACGKLDDQLRWGLLLEPCFQHTLVSAVQVLFLGMTLLLLLQKAVSKLRRSGSVKAYRSPVQCQGRLYKATLVISALATLVYVGFDVWLLISASASASDVIFASLQTLKWLVYVTILAHEKKFAAVYHPWLLRVWWIGDFLLSSLLISSPIAGLTSSSFSYDYVCDTLSLVTFPAAVFLLMLAILGRTGIVKGEATGLTEPLVDGQVSGADGGRVTAYGTANILSRAVWAWLTPVLEKGYKGQLQLTDVPEVAAEDRVENSHARFKKEWPDVPGSHPLRYTLLKCFGRQLMWIGFLAIIRLCVLYVGPVLIQRFEDFTAGKGSRPPLEGIYLVLILLAANTVEVLASHQYNFQGQKLGMVTRSTIIAAVYQKGLRLSSSSKQGHGIGHIVNYMVVDAQQLSDLMCLVHNVWMLPAQVCIALVILYKDLGSPVVVGFVMMVLIMAYNFYISRKQWEYHGSVMQMKDQRMKSTSEVLSFMKIIKFQAWENHFINRIEECRNKELVFLTKFLNVFGQSLVVLWSIGSLVAAVTFGACLLFGVELTSARVFTAISTFRILQEPLRNFPQTIIAMAQSFVSLGRVEKFLLSEELDTAAVHQLPPGGELAIKIEDASFSWEAGELPTLKDINLEVRKGQLITIVGTVGSGKSSILTSVLGEMRKLSGKVEVSGTTAYVPQTAWIQNASIEDNILFGEPMDRARYSATIRACALGEDLKLMEFGDQTEIGERGINLSGGQKQRIQLARAIYQNTDIYLLDDVFSAVDAHTGSHLFQECILGVLKGKTILLVTHQVEFLNHADTILVMRDGAIVQSGKYLELLTSGTDLEALVSAHHTALDSINTKEEREPLVQVKQLEKKKTLSFQRKLSSASKEQTGSSKETGSSKLIDEEARELGRVGWKLYWLYFTKAFGWPTLPTLLLLQTLSTGSSLLSDYWLSYETSLPSFNPKNFFMVYAILTLVSWAFVGARVIFQVMSGLKTSQRMFTDMLRHIFRSPMQFFDTTPSGRILSRASTDQSNMDVLLPLFSGAAMGGVLTAIGTVFVTCQVTWPLIFLVIPLLWIFIYYQNFYLSSSRELTRLDSVTKAPIIFHFSETLAGIVPIRAFKKEDSFILSNLERVNTNISMDFHNNGANEWLGIRLEMIGTTILCTSALLLVTLPDSLIDSEKTGLALSYGLSLNSALFWSVWLLCNWENRMVSVERIRQYTTIESEAPAVIEDHRPPQKWPAYGTISIQNLQLRYRHNTPLVLRGLSLTIQGGSKVGVVGRTGSGKSTLIQAFFRLVEPCGGHIIIDDIDISTLGLADLRSRFGIIPQEPIMFEGSVRSNVDPLGQYSDERIWEVLRRCQLAEALVQKNEGLDSAVTDNGENWSVGQKQLFCLGRALLKESRVLFLDEATASVDAQTDAVIQKTIKEQFASSTVISVAHRIPSVMDSDKVLVMGEGEVKEYDRPMSLLERPTSLFAALVREYTSRSGV